MARMAMSLGLREEALAALERMGPELTIQSRWIGLHDPLFAPLHSDPRFQRLFEARGRVRRGNDTRVSSMKEEMTMKAGLRIIAGVIGVVVIVGGIRKVINGVNAMKHPELTRCDSDDAKETLKLAFNDAPFAKSGHITFREVTGISETAYQPDSIRSCHGSLKLSNRQVHNVNYEIRTEQGSGKVQLHFSMQ